jgi:signal peptidase
MEPAMYRGDLLLLSNRKPVLAPGEIVVFKIDGREIPVVHRILEARQSYVIDCSRSAIIRFVL